MGFPGGSAAKNLPAMQETLVPSLGREDPLKGMPTPSTILTWEIPRTEPGRLQPMRSQEPAATERLNSSSFLAEQGKLTSVFYADSLEKQEMLARRGFAFQSRLESRRQTSPLFLLSPSISDDSSHK